MNDLRSSDARTRAQRLNAYLRRIAPQGREAVTTGPFLATFDLEQDNPYLNYAIPDDDSRPTPQEIEAFAAVCRSRNRKPRLEYVPEAAPELEAALRTAGFEVEMRPPVMTCDPVRLRPAEAPAGFVLRAAKTAEEFAAANAALNLAYAEHNVPDGDPARLMEMCDQGGGCLVALEVATGNTAGAGLFTPPAEGLTEVAGIGVAPAFRRRGLATALTAGLTRTAFEHDVGLAFLTPGGDQAQRAYERAGFEALGEMLMISRP